MLALATLAFAMMACSGGGNASASSEEASASSEQSNQVTYTNEQYNFSVTLPEGFVQQNDDKEMEVQRGGKLFVSDDAMIDVTAHKANPNITIKDDFDYLVNFAYNKEGSELISKELADDHYLVKGKDEWGLRAQYKVVKNGKEIDFMLTYPHEKQAEIDRDVDAMIKSLKVND